jgi:GNAT superfamily N-acetyltransferase
VSFDTDAIERATLAAVPPRMVEEAEGFLLGLDRGTVGRARSAVPLRHVAPPAGAVARLESRYALHRLPALFRVPRSACFDAFRSELSAAGYSASKPTLTLVGRASDMEALGGSGDVEIAARPDADWAAVFLGEGFDPVDGASRLELLRRSESSVFAVVRVEGAVAAVGSACFSHGWCGVHGMRTAPGHRRRGLAVCLLAALGRQARSWGLDPVFLQVEESNTPALALYQRAGLATAWAYEYWRVGSPASAG